MREYIAISAGLAVLTAAVPSHAETVVTDYTAWLAGIGAMTPTETTEFGSIQSNPTSIGLDDSQTLTFGSVASPDPLTISNSGTNPGDWKPLYTTNSSHLYSGQVVDPGFSADTINFSSGLYALGFFISPDGGGEGSVTVTLSDQTSGTSTDINFDGSATQFVGFYGNPGSVDSISISFNGIDLGDFAIADVVDVQGVPEPFSMAVLLTGVMGLGMARRRRI